MLHNSFYLLPELYQLIVLHVHQDRPSLPQDRLALLVKEYRQPKNILRSQEDPLWDLLHRSLQAMVNLKRPFLEAP